MTALSLPGVQMFPSSGSDKARQTGTPDIKKTKWRHFFYTIVRSITRLVQWHCFFLIEKKTYQEHENSLGHNFLSCEQHLYVFNLETFCTLFLLYYNAKKRTNFAQCT